MNWRSKSFCSLRAGWRQRLHNAALVVGALLTVDCRAQQWIRLTVPRFELLTTNRESDARAFLRMLEECPSLQINGLAGPEAHSDKRIKVIAFQSKEEYAPYRLNENAFAHYLHGHLGDYIALQDIRREHYTAAIHEYVHFTIHQADLHVPLWLNEGLSDLYSSVRTTGQSSVVGQVLTQRWTTLQGQSWMKLKDLTPVKHDSSGYNDPRRVPLFYAESWALTHMLALGNGCSDRFPRFLKTMSSGAPVSEAMNSVYGKDLDQI